MLTLYRASHLSRSFKLKFGVYARLKNNKVSKKLRRKPQCGKAPDAVNTLFVRAQAQKC